jgi:hypothetical protein
MKRPAPGTYEDVRQRERERGMRGKADKCRLCKVDLKRFEMEEGLCDKCLRSNTTHVRTEAA